MASDMGGYLGILKWSLKYHDGTKPSPATEMDEETKKWLQECIESVSMDPLDEVKILLKVLEIDSTEQPTESKQEVLQKKGEALADISEYLEDLNLAEGFLSLNGLKIMANLLEDEYAVIRSGAAGVLAAIVQNFEKCQIAAMEIDLLELLITRLKAAMEETQNDDSDGSSSEASVYGEDPSEKLKLVLAISCLVRGNEKATLEFLNKYHGFDLLIQVLSSSFIERKENAQAASRLQQKVLFFLEFLLSERLPAFTKLVDANSFYETIRKCLEVSDSDVVRERVFRLLLKVAKNPTARQHMGDAIPTMLIEQISHVVEAVETEISQSQDEDNSFLEELKGLAQQVAEDLGKDPGPVQASNASASEKVLLLK